MSKIIRHGSGINADDNQWAEAMIEVIINYPDKDLHIVKVGTYERYLALFLRLELNKALSFTCTDTFVRAFPIVEFKIIKQ